MPNFFGNKQGTLFSFISIFTLLCLSFSFHQNMTGNELTYLLQAERFANPNYIANDWFLGQGSGTRLLFEILFYPLSHFASLMTTSILGRVLGYALLSLGLSQIATHLRLRASEVVLIGAAYIWCGQSFIAGEWLFKGIESKVLAYAFIFFGLVVLLKGRQRLGVLFFGLSTSFHILVGGWATLALLLSSMKLLRCPWRIKVQLVLLWCGSACLGIREVIRFFQGLSVQTEFNTANIYTFFRAPHHLDPRAWGMGWYILYMIASVVFLFFVPRIFPGDASRKFLSRFTLATMVPFVGGLIVSLFPSSAKILQLYPFRVGSALLLLFTLLLFIPWILHFLSGKLRRAVVFMLVGFIFLSGTYRFVSDLRMYQTFPHGASSAPAGWHDVCAWIRNRTPPKAVILYPSGLASGLYLMERPAVVGFKHMPASKPMIDEWTRRILDLNGGKAPRVRGWHASLELDQGFLSLSSKQLQHLAKKYNASYIVTKPKPSSNQAPVYTNEHWAVYPYK